jgi:hypothetical protein
MSRKQLKRKVKQVFGESVGFSSGYETRSGRKVKKPKRYSPQHEEELDDEDIAYALKIVEDIEQNPDYSHSESEEGEEEEEEIAEGEEDIKRIAQELKNFVAKQLKSDDDAEYKPPEEEEEEDDEEDDESSSEEEIEAIQKEIEDLKKQEIDEAKEKEADQEEEELVKELGLKVEEEVFAPEPPGGPIDEKAIAAIPPPPPPEEEEDFIPPPPPLVRQDAFIDLNVNPLATAEPENENLESLPDLDFVSFEPSQGV